MVYPKCQENFNNPVFVDFWVNKWCVMYREQVGRALKNYLRQRRSFKRYFEDMGILLNEANYADEQLLQHKSQMSYDSSPCLTMSIRLYISSMLEYLHGGCALEVMGVAELPELFNYLSFVYEMMAINRQQLIQLQIGGKEYMRFVNFDKLSESADYFINARS